MDIEFGRLYKSKISGRVVRSLKSMTGSSQKGCFFAEVVEEPKNDGLYLVKKRDWFVKMHFSPLPSLTKKDCM